MIFRLFLWLVSSAFFFTFGLFCGQRKMMERYKQVECMVCDMRGRYAYYTVRAVNLSNVIGKWKFIGKLLQKTILTTAIAFWFPQILKEGVKYANRTKTKMS